MDTQQVPRPTSKVGTGLSSILNSPEDNMRDSAYYSTNDTSSKHTSAASFGFLNSTYGSVNDKTPSPSTTASSIPQPLVSPSSNMSVASMVVSPTTPGGADARLLDTPGYTDSRRTSVDSRFTQTMRDMGLGNSTSPYTSNNHSTTSIQGTLAQQRHPARPSFDSLATPHRISNGYQPNAERNPDAQGRATRTAPAITGPTSGSIARGPEPVKGQAWAFPEEGSTDTLGYSGSRRSSLADSLASSQYTSEANRLPPGQRRLDDVSPQEFNRRPPTNSSGFPAVHHHSLQQNSQLSELRSGEPSTATGNQPYSRTPELRISHKLAERKRRNEMKELFDQLRDLMPQERGPKASKWEILTKAIHETHNNRDAIKYYKEMADRFNAENQRLHAEVARLRAQLESSSSASHAATLPPVRSIPGPDSMTGVRYEEPRHSNSFPSRPNQF